MGKFALPGLLFRQRDTKCRVSDAGNEAPFTGASTSHFQLNFKTKKTPNQHPNSKLKQQTRKFPLNLDISHTPIQTCYFMQIVTTLLCWGISISDAFLCMVFSSFFFFFGTACKFCDFSKYRVQNTLESGGEGGCLTAQQAL